MGGVQLRNKIAAWQYPRNASRMATSSSVSWLSKFSGSCQLNLGAAALELELAKRRAQGLSLLITLCAIIIPILFWVFGWK